MRFQSHFCIFFSIAAGGRQCYNISDGSTIRRGWVTIRERRMRMKYLKEIAIIFGITMTGELLNTWIPIPIPAGVYGLFILLGLLCSGKVKVSDVSAAGNLLLDLMPLMFIPAAAGLMEKFEMLKAIMLPLVVITVLSTFIVMTVTGKTAEFVLKRQKKEDR